MNQDETGRRPAADQQPSTTPAFGAEAASRRAVVAAGAKLAYAAPAVAASFGLTQGGALAATSRKGKSSRGGKPPVPGTKPGGKPTKIALCHATCSDRNPYVYQEIDKHAIAAHIKNHHKHCRNADIILGPVGSRPFSQADCPGGAISS